MSHMNNLTYAEYVEAKNAIEFIEMTVYGLARTVAVRILKMKQPQVKIVRAHSTFTVTEVSENGVVWVQIDVPETVISGKIEPWEWYDAMEVALKRI